MKEENIVVSFSSFVNRPLFHFHRDITAWCKTFCNKTLLYSLYTAILYSVNSGIINSGPLTLRPHGFLVWPSCLQCVAIIYI